MAKAHAGDIEGSTELKEGEVLINATRIGELYEATRLLGKRILPDGPAVGKVAQCIAMLRSHVELIKEERQMAQDQHMPKDESMPTAKEGDPVAIVDPMGLKRKLDEIERRKRVVALPKSKLTDEMMPKSLATKPENVEGLGEIKGLLMPELFAFPE